MGDLSYLFIKTVTLAQLLENKSEVALFSVIKALSVGKNSAAWVRLGK